MRYKRLRATSVESVPQCVSGQCARGKDMIIFSHAEVDVLLLLIGSELFSDAVWLVSGFSQPGCADSISSPLGRWSSVISSLGGGAGKSESVVVDDSDWPMLCTPAWGSLAVSLEMPLPRETDSSTEEDKRKLWLSICTVTSLKAIISLLALRGRFSVQAFCVASWRVVGSISIPSVTGLGGVVTEDPAPSTSHTEVQLLKASSMERARDWTWNVK